LGVNNSLDLNIRLLTFKPILKPFINILKTVIIKGKIIKNNIYKAISNYNNNNIIININKVNNKIDNLRLYKYTPYLKDLNRITIKLNIK
jgi:topoisomerase IA-like protein